MPARSPPFLNLLPCMVGTLLHRALQAVLNISFAAHPEEAARVALASPLCSLPHPLGASAEASHKPAPSSA
jgi:hypothetical protein